MRTRFSLPICLVALLVSAGCGGDEDGTGPDGSEISPEESLAMATEIMSGTVDALNSGTQQSPAMSAGGVPVAINVQYTNKIFCPGGGSIDISGSASGSLETDTGTGSIFVQVLETITDCVYAFGEGVEGQRVITLNGNPNLSATGTFTFVGGALGTQQTVRIGGGFNYDAVPGRSGFCAVSLTILLNTVGGGSSVSGTVCGNQLNFTV